MPPPKPSNYVLTQLDLDNIIRKIKAETREAIAKELEQLAGSADTGLIVAWPEGLRSLAGDIRKSGRIKTQPAVLWS